MTKQELQKQIGQNLLRYRAENHLTREEIAEKIGISATFYASLECGKKMMSLKTLKRITEVLSISSDYLLNIPGPNPEIRNIEMILNGKPQEFLIFVEKMIRLCAEEFAISQENN